MTHTSDPFDPGAWVDAPGCDAFEIALDMREQAALSSSALPVLEAHLAACPSCREYGERATQVGAALAACAGEPASPTWQHIEGKLASSVTRYKRTPWVLAGSGLVGLIVFSAVQALLGEGIPSARLLVLVFGGYMALMGSVYYWNLRRMRRLLEQRDVVAAYRGELERSLAITARTRWLHGALVLLYLLQGGHALYRVLHGDVHARYTLVTSALLLLAWLAAIVFTRRAQRNARRELAELH